MDICIEEFCKLLLKVCNVLSVWSFQHGHALFETGAFLSKWMSWVGSVAAHRTGVFQWLITLKLSQGSQTSSLLFSWSTFGKWYWLLHQAGFNALLCGQFSPRWSCRSQELSLAFRSFSFWKKVDTVNNLKGFSSEQEYTVVT